MARTCTKKKWKYDSSGLRLTYKSKCIAIGNKQTRSDTNKHSPSNWNNRVKSWSLTKNVIPGFCSQKCTTGICDCSSLIGIHDSFKACNSFNMHVPHRQCTQSHDDFVPCLHIQNKSTVCHVRCTAGHCEEGSVFENGGFNWLVEEHK